MQVGLIAGGALALIALAVVVSYNRFVEQGQLVDNSWANVDTELRRRYDLVPNLVRTVEGYASHERSVLESVVQARTAAIAADGDIADQVGPERTLVRSLTSLLALAEAYPDIKADAHFLELQAELVTTEDRIQAARRLFNANVRDINRRVEAIPSNLIAALFGFRRRDYFEIEPVVRDAGPPRVETS